jgi:alpha-L-fucosidase
VADRPDGPFLFVRTLLRGRKHEGVFHAFDSGSVYNPHVKQFKGKTFLYYVGNHDPSAERLIGNRQISVKNQVIGVLEADSVIDLAMGRFVRRTEPIFTPASRIRADIPEEKQYGDKERITPANIVVVNPSMERRPDGKYLLMFKGWASGDGRWLPIHGVALGDSPIGPFQVQPDPVLAIPIGNGEFAPAEDPYLWYSKPHSLFFALAKDHAGKITGQRCLVLFQSKDGIDWEPASQEPAVKLELRWEDGSLTKLQNLERAQLLFDEAGEPIMLYAAAAEDRFKHSFNVQIPLKAHVLSQLPRPTPAQYAWQEAELGFLISYELHTFSEGRYDQRKARITPIENADHFNPEQLDTDQWIRAVKAAGGRFALLTASHESGFRLWQSEVNPFCLKAVPWGGGKRDIVREFKASCEKYGILPGIYMGTRWNAKLGVFDFKVTERSSITQEEYNRLIEQEVKEICTNYGDWFEFWFDGGAHGPEQGGPDLLPIVAKHQSQALFYHNLQRADARWGGSESGTVPYPCWVTFPIPSTGAGETAQKEIHKNGFALLKHGDPDGAFWMPAMSDAPLRGFKGHEWFWEPGDEKLIYPLEKLLDKYCRSVGHNSTLILGITPDTRGLLPQADVKRLEELGQALRRMFSALVAKASGKGYALELTFPEKSAFDLIVIQEEILQGERVREYSLEIKQAGAWRPLAQGSCIGHKRIHRLPLIEAEAIRLKVGKARALPLIRELAVYCTQKR